MADVLGDGEFWLPSEFLTDDDFLLDKPIFQKGVTNSNNREPRFCFPSDFPCCGGYPSYGSSALDSPVESLAGSTETESDEDDYLAGFTRDMARSLFQVQADRPSSVFAADNPKIMVKAGSPQSPLCGLGSWTSCRAGSSHGIPSGCSPQSPLCGLGSWTSCSAGSRHGTSSGCSLVSSPPTTAFSGRDDAWGLLYAAAGQMARMKLNDSEDMYCSRGGGVVGVPHKPNNPKAVPLTQQQIQANHFLELKKQQQQCFPVWERQAQYQQNGGRSVGFGNGTCTKPSLGLSPAWPQLEQHHQSGSGMRAVFLGVGGSGGRRRECAGTGVFLPRSTNGFSSEPQRKHGCSTVLLPNKVVQALNRSFHDMGGCVGLPQQQQHQHQHFVGGLGGGGGGPTHPYQQQRRSYHTQPAINTEVQLPQEWTY